MKQDTFKKFKTISQAILVILVIIGSIFFVIFVIQGNEETKRLNKPFEDRKQKVEQFIRDSQFSIQADNITWYYTNDWEGTAINEAFRINYTYSWEKYSCYTFSISHDSNCPSGYNQTWEFELSKTNISLKGFFYLYDLQITDFKNLNFLILFPNGQNLTASKLDVIDCVYDPTTLCQIKYKTNLVFTFEFHFSFYQIEQIIQQSGGPTLGR